MREIELFDGTVLEFPPETSDEVIDRVAKQETQARRQTSAPADAPKGDASRWGASREAISGATLGAAIPITSAIVSPLEMIATKTLDPVAAYKSARDKMDADRQAYLDANPRLGLAANAIGGLAIGGTLGKGGGTFAGRFGSGPVARIGEAAAEGAAYGGVSGFNESRSDSIAGDVGSAVQGAGIGAALGGGLAGAGQVIGAASQGVRSAVRGAVDPEGYAAGKVAQRLQQDGVDVTTLNRRLTDSPGSTIADVAGENTRDLVRTVNNIGGRGRQAVTDMVDERLSSQRDTLMGGVSKKLAPGDMYHATLDDIVANYRKGADAYYKKAYSKPVNYDDFALDELMPRIPKQAWSEANALMKVEGYTPKQLIANIADDGTVTMNRVPDMKQWDYLKRGLDNLINKEEGAGAIGGTSPMGRALTNLKGEILSVLDKQNPTYARARKFSSDQIGLKKALESGGKLLTMPLDDSVKAFKSLSKAEQETARISLARAIRDKVLAGSDNSDRVKAVWNEKTRKLLANVFEPKDFNSFSKFMTQQAAQMKTVNAARYNSTTARQLASMDEAGNDAAVGVLLDAAKGNFASAALNAIGRTAKRMGGLNEKSAGSMSDILLSGGSGATKIQEQLAKAQEKLQRGAQRATGLLPVPARLSGLLGGYTVREGRAGQ